MEKSYNETPKNFEEVLSYVYTEPDTIARIILEHPKCYFYDTCAFRKHAELEHPEPLFEHIRGNGGVVLITRCVLMELCSGDDVLWQQHIDFLTQMNYAGIPICIMYEEDAWNVLHMYYRENNEINQCLTYAIRSAKSSVGTVQQTLDQLPALKRETLSGTYNRSGTLFHRFFKAVRANKESGDSLGEELIAMVMHLLSNIPEMAEYKYILLTEDKGAIALLQKVMDNVKQHMGKPYITAATSAKLAQLHYFEELIRNPEQMEDFLRGGNHGEQIRVYCAEKYELEVMFRTYSCRELAQKICGQDDFRIFF